MKKFALISIFAVSLMVLPHALAARNVISFTSWYANEAISFGQASWYSKQSPGINRHTANNEIFDDTDMTCAMWGVPFNTRFRVTNIANGRSVIVRVNDRGPHPRFVRQGRIIDLSKAAFREIGALKKGLLHVKVEAL